MRLETSCVTRRQRPFEIVGNELDRLLGRRGPDGVWAASWFCQLWLEAGTYPASAAVQKYPLVGFADLEHVTYFLA